jgi:hypothetical protein
MIQNATTRQEGQAKGSTVIGGLFFVSAFRHTQS